MSSSLTLKVASVTSVITFSNKTDAEIAQILRWFVSDFASAPPEGATQAQINQHYLDAAAEKTARLIRNEAARLRTKDIKRTQQSPEVQAEQETNL